MRPGVMEALTRIQAPQRTMFPFDKNGHAKKNGFTLFPSVFKRSTALNSFNTRGSRVKPFFILHYPFFIERKHCYQF